MKAAEKPACKIHDVYLRPPNENLSTSKSELSSVLVEITACDGTWRTYRWFSPNHGIKTRAMDMTHPTMSPTLHMVSTHHVPKLSIIWKPVRIHGVSASHVPATYIACFSNADFVLWCPRTNAVSKKSPLQRYVYSSQIAKRSAPTYLFLCCRSYGGSVAAVRVAQCL